MVLRRVGPVSDHACCAWPGSRPWYVARKSRTFCAVTVPPTAGAELDVELAVVVGAVVVGEVCVGLPVGEGVDDDVVPVAVARGLPPAEASQIAPPARSRT